MTRLISLVCRILNYACGLLIISALALLVISEIWGYRPLEQFLGLFCTAFFIAGASQAMKNLAKWWGHGD